MSGVNLKNLTAWETIKTVIDGLRNIIIVVLTNFIFISVKYYIFLQRNLNPNIFLRDTVSHIKTILKNTSWTY